MCLAGDAVSEVQKYIEDPSFPMLCPITSELIHQQCYGKNISLLSAACFFTGVRCVKLLLESPRRVDVNYSSETTMWLTPVHFLLIGARRIEQREPDEEWSVSAWAVPDVDCTNEVLEILDLMFALRGDELNLNTRAVHYGTVLNTAITSSVPPVVLRIMRMGGKMFGTDDALMYGQYTNIVVPRLVILALLSATLPTVMPRRMRLPKPIIRAVMKALVNDSFYF